MPIVNAPELFPLIRKNRKYISWKRSKNIDQIRKHPHKIQSWNLHAIHVVHIVNNYLFVVIINTRGLLRYLLHFNDETQFSSASSPTTTWMVAARFAHSQQNSKNINVRLRREMGFSQE